MQNPVKCNVLYTVGVCPAYLFVAGSIILLQCLSMIHKAGTNLMNDEIWRLLPIKQMPNFGELENKSIMSNRWKRNKFTWHLLQQGIDLRWTFKNHTHLGQHWADFFQSLHMSICQEAWITQWKFLKKHLLHLMLLVSPNDKRYDSYLGTSVGLSPMKILFTSYYQIISFRNTVLSQKFEARFFLLLISC